MNTNELDYDLPTALIAQHPAERRDAARLLVIERATGKIHSDVFQNMPQYLRAGDRVVLNDTKVIRARLKGHKASGGRVEVFLLRELVAGEWAALVRPSAKVRAGTVIALSHGQSLTVEEVLPAGQRRVRFAEPDVLAVLEAVGEIPLPPYIHRTETDASDLRRYQTIYAASPGAVAAPTAGLHFTDGVFQDLASAGVDRSSLTLHVGYGTFKPITSETVEEHLVAPESFALTSGTAKALNATRSAGGRIVAVGTTATRVLETQYQSGCFEAGVGETDTYLYPPYTFQGVDVLQTNFHLPRSSLLALVCAFAGTALVMAAYRRAVAEEFRFYSYGDAMLIL